MGKYAVVIGVNYVKNPEAALQGCCNDARIMYKLLQTKGFEESNIKLLVDDDDSYDSPNHINVKKALEWLCSGREPGDIIFMHFSGHGTQVPADDDDVEHDKLDEAICLEELFLMADDDLKQFFGELPEGVHATVVMDCCHSGSMLDGTEIAIEGAKDEDSEAPQEESSSLLNILGGSRSVAEGTANRSLPISTICSVMSQKVGHSVEPTGSGINGAMAQVFGGTAGKLMMKFALSKLQKDGGAGSPLVGIIGNLMGGKSSGSGNPLLSLIGGGGSTQTSSTTSSGGDKLGSLIGSFMGGNKTSTSGSSGGSNPLGSMMGGLMGGGGSGSSGGNPLSSLMGGGGGSTSTTNTTADAADQDPMAMLQGLIGGMGLGGQQEGSSAPPYNPSHQPLSRDVCTLITGCQSHETSADVRPAGGEAFGALTKTLTGVLEKDPSMSYYDLVSGVRQELSKGGFKQNPCLECSEDMAGRPFIC